ncbi:hypothetical protein BLNAU_16960 [Blattamonas nauphoetae]|uniref:Uncharacterized protein n=1 Tax=Blattamonas nauphoetae TaxID=2049346 RepID=A0ABQ9XBQ1_9EUKA|nr:hypothetical protein BLNAU_16960 [Blattamonas nauphoetae]
MKVLDSLIQDITPHILLGLVKANLIPQLIITLNPQSLSFAEAEDIHACFISIITSSTWLATQMGLDELEKKHPLERHTMHQTVLDQVLVPSEDYLLHLCVNRFSIIDGDQSSEFMLLLGRLLHISPYYQPTLDFVLDLPIVLTIPSCLTFVETDSAIRYFFLNMLNRSENWKNQAKNIRLPRMTLLRSLRMEGLADVSEQKLQNCKWGSYGREIVRSAIRLNITQGMNLERLE